MSNIDPGTRILNIDDRDSNWVKILFDPYTPAPPGGWTKGLLASLQEFYNLYAIDAANIRNGFNFSGTIPGLYQVKVDADDLQGYLGDKIKVSNGLTLTIDGTTNKVLDFALQLNTTSALNGHSLVYDDATIMELTQGYGVTLEDDGDSVKIRVSDALLEQISYGIKYAWDTEAEMLAQTGMGADDLGVRNDLSEVWKYTGTEWEYFFTLGTSTTAATEVLDIPGESYSGVSTDQQGVNYDTTIQLKNIYNLLIGNSPAYGSLIGDPLPQAITATATVPTWSTVDQSNNTEVWEFNDTANEILIKKAGFYTFNTNIDMSNSSSQSRVLRFTTRDKNNPTTVFYTRPIIITRNGGKSQTSITFEVPEDNTTIEILANGETIAGAANDDLTFVDWKTTLLLNFLLVPIAPTGSGQFPLQWVYEDFEGVDGVDGKFNINNSGIKISKNMFSNEDKTTFVDMSTILSDLTTGNSLVLVDEDGNKGFFTFNTDFTDEGTYYLCDDYTETGVFNHNIGQTYNFQLLGLSSGGGSVGTELSGCSFNIPRDTARAISTIGNTWTRLNLRDSNDVATVKTIGTDLSYNSTLDSIKNDGTEDIDVTVDFNVDVIVTKIDGDFNMREWSMVVGLVSSNGTVVVESDGELADFGVDGEYNDLVAFQRYKNYSGSVLYTMAPDEELNLQSYLDSFDGANMTTGVRTASINVVQVGNSVSSGTSSDTRFLSTYEATYDGTGYPIVPTTNGEVRWTFAMGNVIFNIFKKNVDGETVYNLSNINVGDLVSVWVLDNPTSRVIEVEGFTDEGDYWILTGQSKTNSGTFVDGDKIVIEYEPSATSNSGQIVNQGVNYYNLGSNICNNSGSPDYNGSPIVNVSTIESNGTAWLMKSSNGNVLTDIPTVDNRTFSAGLSPAVPLLDNTKAIKINLITGNCRVLDPNRNDKTGTAFVELNVFEIDSASITSTNHTLIGTYTLYDTYGTDNVNVVGANNSSNSYVTFELSVPSGIFTLDNEKQYGFTISGTNNMNAPDYLNKMYLMDTAILTVLYEGEVL